MDESGFDVGEEQSMNVLVHLDQAHRPKIIGGEQEWIADIECIDAAGEALPSL